MHLPEVRKQTMLCWILITLSKNENGNDLANGKWTLIAIQNYSLPRRDRETGQ
jgi:hypothetical protein